MYVVEDRRESENKDAVLPSFYVLVHKWVGADYSSQSLRTLSHIKVLVKSAICHFSVNLFRASCYWPFSL